MPDDQSDRGRELMPIDLENCIRMFNGEKDVALSLIGDLLELYQKQKDIILRALADHDHEKLRREGHSIKGGAAVLSAGPLMKAAALLEEMGKSGDLAGAEEAFARLEEEIARLTDCYMEFMR